MFSLSQQTPSLFSFSKMRTVTRFIKRDLILILFSEANSIFLGARCIFPSHTLLSSFFIHHLSFFILRSSFFILHSSSSSYDTLSSKQQQKQQRQHKQQLYGHNECFPQLKEHRSHRMSLVRRSILLIGRSSCETVSFSIQINIHSLEQETISFSKEHKFQTKPVLQRQP